MLVVLGKNTKLWISNRSWHSFQLHFEMTKLEIFIKQDMKNKTDTILYCLYEAIHHQGRVKVSYWKVISEVIIKNKQNDNELINQ